MIHYLKGNVLESGAEALVNTVNLVGVMGKGVALQFKKAYPDNFKAYEKACRNGDIAIGKLFVTEDVSVNGHKYIINFPTKTTWRKPSEYSYISAGLDDLIRFLKEKNIRSVAMPPLGSGNGGLHWERVKGIIADKLSGLDIDIEVYEPSEQIVELMRQERVKLSDARALLLYVLFDLVLHGEYVSEFSSEKVCYFLQKFGAADLFNLRFEPRYYGPYSGKVRYVLYALNGSYIMGYSGMDKKPFDALTLVADGHDEVKAIVEGNERLKEIATKTMNFLDGFYSDYGLELLSSVDYILGIHPDADEDKVYEYLKSWSSRKGQLFANPEHIRIALQHLRNFSI